MARITFKSDLCKGCGLCVEACPKGLISIDAQNINQKGYNFASVKDEQACIACGFCARMCPDCVISVEK